MSWSAKFRSKSFTEAAETLAKSGAPEAVVKAARELMAECPHPENVEIPRHGDQVEKGPQLEGYEVEVTTAGHFDAHNFDASLAIKLVAPAAGPKSIKGK